MNQKNSLTNDHLSSLLREDRFTQLIHTCEQIESDSCSTSEQRLQAKVYLAHAYLRTGSLERGFAKIQELEAAQYPRAEVLTLKGLGLFVKGELEQAFEQFNLALTEDFSSVEALTGLGWCTRTTSPHDAWEYFTAALRLDPSHRAALRGICTLPFPADGGKPLESLLRTALDADPLNSEVRISLAVCLYSMGRLEEAMCEVTKVTLVDPNATLAVDLKNKLAEIIASTPERSV